MREYELEVLDQYDIEVFSTRKIRGAFFCDTKEGTMLLKETGLSEQRALLLYTVLRHLEAAGYTYVDTPVLTRENTFLATFRENGRYMLKKWFVGRECDVRREPDLVEASSNLAGLHAEMRLIGDAKLPEGRHLKEEFLCHNREMKKVRSFIRKKVNKGEFEYRFLESFDKMYRLAQNATEHLEESGYEELYRESREKKTLVHGDYNYHNVLMLPGTPLAGNTEHIRKQVIATTNFEHCRIDVQVQDLYYFLRKVMEKHRWQERFGRVLLDAYAKVRPLDEREREFIAIKLAYPEKFWKIASTYYHSNKAWIPEKNVEKLQTAIAQTEEKLRFIEKVFEYKFAWDL